MTLLEQLVKDGLINRYQIDEIMAKVDDAHDIESIVMALGVDEDAFLKSKSTFYAVPAKRVSSDSISFEILQTIPYDAASHYRLVPLGFTEDGTLEVGMVDPGDVEARNAMQFIAGRSGLRFTLFAIPESDLMQVLESYSHVGGSDTADAVSNVEAMTDIGKEAEGVNLPVQNSQQKQSSSKYVNSNTNRIVEDAPVTKMFAVILRHAIEGRASDIHIENTGEKVKVRFRVDGVLYTSLLLPKNVHDAVVARVKIMAKLKLDERRKPQDGRFLAKINSRQVDFRVSTFPTYHGEKVVIRILDPDSGVKSLEGTGMYPHHLQLVKKALKRPYGMILISGPTGSGKTTTLYSMLRELDREGRNVVSLEDPIEYNIPGMSQSQVRPEIGYTFANGLRSILRQDPDIIMVGEIRDKETAQLAIQAALTGHMVFSTLHTNNAVGVIPRLIDMGVDPYLVAPTLNLAIGQRLVRRICDGAASPVVYDESTKIMVQKQFGDLDPQYQANINVDRPFNEAGQTSECPSGLRGRVAVYEMFNMNPDIERLVLNNPSDFEIYNQVRKQGMLTMREDAMLKSMDGIVPFHEVHSL